MAVGQKQYERLDGTYLHDPILLGDNSSNKDCRPNYCFTTITHFLTLSGLLRTATFTVPLTYLDLALDNL